MCCGVFQVVTTSGCQQHNAAHWQHTALHCNTLHHTATHCSTLQHAATHCIAVQNTLQDTATHRNTLQHTATHCNTLQHTATLCNTLQHTAGCQHGHMQCLYFLIVRARACAHTHKNTITHLLFLCLSISRTHTYTHAISRSCSLLLAHTLHISTIVTRRRHHMAQQPCHACHTMQHNAT